jgi:NADPH:quinone reductase-like Zn-dependent oxidoreductase
VRAAAFREYGPPEVLEYTEVADPVVGPDDVLVQMRACGVNHSDLDSRAGTSRWPFPMPMVLGAEFTGTVAATGAEVSSVRPGDLVTAHLQSACGRCASCARWRPDLCLAFEIFGTTRWGGYGELVSVPERAIVPLEAGDDLIAMAAGQCVVSTAWHMVNRLAVVRSGDLVLVPSAAGGVAGALVQCAKLAGATVVGTARTPAKADYIRSLGADEVVSYEGSDLAGGLLAASGGRRYDAVLDTVGGPLFGTHLSVLREDGALVTCGAHAGEVVPLDIIPLFRHGWRILGFRVAPPDELDAALRLIRSGAVRVPVAATYPLSEGAEAHRVTDRREVTGKIVLTGG